MGTALSLLTFGSPTVRSPDPTLSRRANFTLRLEEQLALLTNPSQTRTVMQTELGEDGQRKRVVVQKKIRPWWRLGEGGKAISL